MSNKFKDISIQNCTDYFLNDISNMKRLTNKLASKGLQEKLLFTESTCADQRFEIRKN